MVNSLEGQIKRFAKQQEKKATLYEYTKSGTDDYGDPDWDDPSETTIYILDEENNPQPRNQEQGDTQEIDVTLQVQGGVDIQDEDQVPDGRADEIEIGHRRFRVLNVKDEMGIKLVDATRLDDGT
jgi:hypothetical protein